MDILIKVKYMLLLFLVILQHHMEAWTWGKMCHLVQPLEVEQIVILIRMYISGTVLNYNMKEAAKVVKEENERVANAIGINKSARTTTVKPAGTTSLCWTTEDF